MTLKSPKPSAAKVRLLRWVEIRWVVIADYLASKEALLELRNFYHSADSRQEGANQSKRDECARGILLIHEFATRSVACAAELHHVGPPVG